MAVLASDIIARSLKALRVLGSTDTPNAADANDGLVAFNAMLDSWSNENLLAFEVLVQSFVMTIGKTTYTIGATGSPDISGARPLAIEDAYLLDSNSIKYGMAVVSRETWTARTGLSTVTSQVPDTLWYDPQYPLGVINIFPSPLLASTVVIDTYLQQALFAALTTQLSTPPGYERAYVFNLAVEIASQFGIPIPAVGPGQKNVVEIANEARANIKRKNIRENIADMDRSIVSRSKSTYNIYRDGP